MNDLIGWRARYCQGGNRIFNIDNNYLIGLANTEEECEAICNAIPECNIALFLTGNRFPEINRCIPKTGFIGGCGQVGTRKWKSYIKDTSSFSLTNLTAGINKLYAHCVIYILDLTFGNLNIFLNYRP